MSVQKLQHRIAKIRQHLGEAQLVAVTKYSEHSDLSNAYQCGLRDFGENRVDDLLLKDQWARSAGLHDIRWHFIGHLQSNKLNKLFELDHLVAIHSVDSYGLLQKILAKTPKQPVDLYLQVKTSFEEEKTGYTIDSQEWLDSLELLKQSHAHFVFKGLMTMAPIRVDEIAPAARQCFSTLRQLRDRIQPSFTKPLGLSMGMSGDYQCALEEGASIVRLGSILFKDE